MADGDRRVCMCCTACMYTWPEYVVRGTNLFSRKVSWLSERIFTPTCLVLCVCMYVCMYAWNEVLCVYVCACALTTKLSTDVTSHMRFPHEADIATISSFTYRWKYLITAYLICMYVCMYVCVYLITYR